MVSGADSGSFPPLEALARLQMAHPDANSTVPAEFKLERHYWHLAIMGATEAEKEIELALQQRMREDVEAGKLTRITERSEYLCLEEWRLIAQDHGDDSEEAQDRLVELYNEMISRVQAGDSPYGARKLFSVAEWDATLELFIDEDSKAGVQQLFKQMIHSVLFEEGDPYSPDLLFKKAAWDQARNDIPNNAEESGDKHKEILNQLYNECRKQFLVNRGEVAMDSPNRALFNHYWKGLERGCDDISALRELRDLAQADADEYFDEQELIIPPIHEKPAEMSTALFLELLEQHILNERQLAADKAWQEELPPTKDIAQRAEYLNRWQKMRNAFKRSGHLYRPQTIPADKEDLAARARDIGFGNMDGIRSGHWLYRGVLGEGSYGVATIWVKLDGHGRVVDHEVVKDTYMEESWDKSNWDQPFFWDGPIEDRVPLEWTIVRELRQLPDSENIVEYHAKRIYEQLKMYRIYMEYGDHGTLHDLLKNYRAFGNDGVKDRNGNPLPNNIPLRLAWSIFAQLAKALCLAHHGHDAWQTDVPNHDPIVHRDIKCANIFIATRPAALSNRWPELPVVKLADWGLASRMSNKQCMKWACGTRGWKAPELYRYDADIREDLSIPDVTEKSDIFSIALVVLALLNLDSHPEPYTFEDDDRDWELTHPNKDVYDQTPELMGLLDKCLQKDPEARPCAKLLLRAIDVVVGDLEESGEGELPWNERGRQDGEILLWEDSKHLKWAR